LQVPAAPLQVSFALPSTAAGLSLPFALEISIRRGLRCSGFGIRT
jgi:hypothetical protein